MTKSVINYGDNEGDIILPGERKFPKEVVNDELFRIIESHSFDATCSALCEGVSIYGTRFDVWYAVFSSSEVGEKEVLVEEVNKILSDEGVRISDYPWPIAARVSFDIPEDSFLYYDDSPAGHRWIWDYEKESLQRVEYVRVGARVFRP